METMDTAPSWLSDTWWVWHPEEGHLRRAEPGDSHPVWQLSQASREERRHCPQMPLQPQICVWLRMLCTNCFSQRWRWVAVSSYSEKPSATAPLSWPVPSRWCPLRPIPTILSFLCSRRSISASIPKYALSGVFNPLKQDPSPSLQKTFWLRNCSLVGKSSPIMRHLERKTLFPRNYTAADLPLPCGLSYYLGQWFQPQPFNRGRPGCE